MHTLAKLPYDFTALEPIIDAKTMEIHYGKHHQGYVDKLNSALEGNSQLQAYSVEELLQNIDKVPEKIKTAVRNNAGGHANHSLFWTILSPEQTNPSEDLSKQLAKTFGSVENFKKEFEQAALTRFGSGWAWLTLKGGKLKVFSTANQDSPLMDGDIPVLGLDVWEHAYYLSYQNKRADYVGNFWKIVNWPEVERRLEAARY